MRSASFLPNTIDLIAASRLHFWSSFKWKLTVWGYVAGCLLFAVIGALFTQLESGWPPMIGAGLGIVFWSFVLICIFTMNYILIPARSRRAFRQLKTLQSATDVSWSSKGVQLQSAQGSSDFDWRDFVRIVEGQYVILLFQSDYLFNFIPKRAVSDEQARDLIALANRRRA
jgi:hypothetical protein